MNSSKPNVCMLVYNTFRPDIRVLKEAKTLDALGCRVRVLALSDQAFPERETFGRVRLQRIMRNPFHYRMIARLKKSKNVLTAPVIPNATPDPDAGADESLVQSRTDMIFKKILLLSVVIIVVSCAAWFMIPADKFWPWMLAVPALAALMAIAGRRPIWRFWTILWRKTRRRLKSALIRTAKFFLFPGHKLFSYCDFYKRSSAVLRENPADIYHAHDLNTLPVAWWCARRQGALLVYDSHELFTEAGLLGGLEKKIWARIERRLIKKCDLVITVCESIASELQQRYKINPPVVLRNCPQKNTVPLQRDLIRQAAGIDAGIPVVLYQGGFAPNRGLRNLILSVRYFKRGKLVMMGWGNMEGDLREFARENGLEDSVFFIPPAPQKDLLSWSASADVGVIPYRAVSLNNYYTCPNKLFEYINSGLPVAGSNFPEIRKILEGWKAGKTFDPQDPEDIARAINHIIGDSEIAAEMRANALEAARELNWEHESRKLTAAYADLKNHAGKNTKTK